MAKIWSVEIYFSTHWWCRLLSITTSDYIIVSLVFIVASCVFGPVHVLANQEHQLVWPRTLVLSTVSGLLCFLCTQRITFLHTYFFLSCIILQSSRSERES